ncbi:MAG TPA: hypothetical protein VJQ25_04880, partial [Nitrospira sp.]|nr:hypothetical protein [Nitrospira sp.]
MHLDAKAGTTGSTQPRLRKATVWRSIEEVTAWRLLNDAKGLVSNGKVFPEKGEASGGGHGQCQRAGPQLALYQQLQMKLPRQRTVAVSNKL